MQENDIQHQNGIFNLRIQLYKCFNWLY